MRRHATAHFSPWALGLCVALLISISGSSLIVPPAPQTVPVPYTPSCQYATYADVPALLNALDSANYACTEEIATALVQRADPPLVATLLANTTDPARDTRARRNSLRTLGRFADAPRTSRAHTLALGRYGAELQATATQALSSESDAFLLQDAIWMLDQFFYPSRNAAQALEALAYNQELDAAVRFRAAKARTRLVWVDGPPLSFDAVAFMHTGLANPDPGVRAAAADAIARLRSDQLTPELYRTLNIALVNAWAVEPPLALSYEPEAHPERNPLLSGTVESVPTDLTARAAIARARDRLEPGVHLFAELRSAYEALALPVTHVENCIVIRADHPATVLPGIARRMILVEQAFNEIIGPGLGAPIPEEFCVLTVMIFGSRTIYREYMRAFTPFTVDIDGTYYSESGTLYTHQRTPQQSGNSLEVTIQHEMTHHLTARTIFPGNWSDPAYHREPKGWADEGLAEVLAGLQPTATGYELAPRQQQLERVCANPPPSLAALLARREGSDRYGHFDYDNAWSLTYYLVTERPEAARRIYASYRAGTYRLQNWPALAGTPSLATFEAEWHAAIEQWCANEQESGFRIQESEGR
jgi:hypothetical protein